jgi:hypothetical protein
MKYYEASFNAIKPVEVEKESESSVWIKGRVNKKISSYTGFFKTWDEARNYLINQIQQKIDSAKRSLEYYDKEDGYALIQSQESLNQ